MDTPTHAAAALVGGIALAFDTHGFASDTTTRESHSRINQSINQSLHVVWFVSLLFCLVE